MSLLARVWQGHWAGRALVGLGSITVANAILSLAAVLCVTSLYPAVEAGIYFLFVAISTVIAAVILGPMRPIATRFGTLYVSNGDGASLRGLTLAGIVYAGCCYLFLKAVLSAMLPRVPLGEDVGLLASAPIAECAALAGLLGLLVGLVRASGRVFQGQVPELLVRPVGIVIIILAASVFGIDVALWNTYLTVQVIGVLYLFSLIVSDKALRSGAGVRWRSEWRREFPAVAVAGTVSVLLGQADILIVGFAVGADSLASYKLAAQCATLVAAGIGLTNVVYGPSITLQHAKGDLAGLQSTVKSATRFSFAVGVVGTLGLLFVGTVVSVVDERARATMGILVVLLVGRVVDAFYGPLTSIATMVGSAGLVVRAQAAALVFGVLLMLSLGMLVGAIGVAIGAAVALTLWNVVLGRSIERKTGILCGVV